MSISCVTLILASGQGSRFKGIKQLADIEGQPMLLRVARQQSKLTDDLVIVLGAHSDAILSELEEDRYNAVVNENWRQGMASSIACGVEYIAKAFPNATHILIALADQPFIPTRQFKALITKSQALPDTVVAAAYSDTIGVPAIFPKQYWGKLRSLEGDKGARNLLRNTSSIVTVSVPEAARDIDLSADLD